MFRVDQFVLLCLVCMCSAGKASAFEVFADLGVKSAAHDRGEQIAPLNLEAGVTIETAFNDHGFYGGVYRLMPIGDHQDSFDDEFDYVFGYAREIVFGGLDISANWITFPGTDGGSTLELGGVLGFNAPLSPELAVFYDTESEDFGAELAILKEWELSDWTTYGLARIGFVQPGDDADANRSYTGIEFGIGRPVAENVDLTFFARADFADEDSFVDDYASDLWKDNGSMVGLALAFQLH